RVLRRDLPRPRAGGILAYACGVLVVAVLIAWQAQEAQAASIMLGGVAGLLIAAAALAWLLLTLLKRVPQRGVSWRFRPADPRLRALAASRAIPARARVGVEPAARRAGPRPDVAAAADRRAGRPAARLAREPSA